MVKFQALHDDADLLGLCCGSEITVTTEISGRLLLDTVIHELLHRECPSMQHKKVYAVANAIAKELWDLGYRRPEITICLKPKSM